MLDRVERVRVDLFGSLALTGLGHATDHAVLLGLAGNEPACIDPAIIDSTVGGIRSRKLILLVGTRAIAFEEVRDLVFDRERMVPPDARMRHPNGMRFSAFDAAGATLDKRTFFSVGGGFIVEDAAEAGNGQSSGSEAQAMIPIPFRSAAELLAVAQANELSIGELMLENIFPASAPHLPLRWSAKDSQDLEHDAQLHGARRGGGRHPSPGTERAAPCAWPG